MSLPDTKVKLGAQLVQLKAGKVLFMVEILVLPCVTCTPSGSHAWTVDGSLEQGLCTLIFCCA